MSPENQNQQSSSSELSALEQFMLYGEGSIPEVFDWQREVLKWQYYYRAQSLWYGSRRKFGNPLLIPVSYVPKRQSRRLKRLNRLAQRSLQYCLFDEPYIQHPPEPTTHYTVLQDGTIWNNMTGESLPIGTNRHGLSPLQKVSGVRSKRRRSRKKP